MAKKIDEILDENFEQVESESNKVLESVEEKIQTQEETTKEDSFVETILQKETPVEEKPSDEVPVTEVPVEKKPADEVPITETPELPIDEKVENLTSKMLRETIELAKQHSVENELNTILDCIKKSSNFSYYHCGRLIRNGISVQKLIQFYNEFKNYGIQNKTEADLIYALEIFVTAFETLEASESKE